jgi:hypothetical protein
MFDPNAKMPRFVRGMAYLTSGIGSSSLNGHRHIRNNPPLDAVSVM